MQKYLAIQIVLSLLFLGIADLIQADQLLSSEQIAINNLLLASLACALIAVLILYRRQRRLTFEARQLALTDQLTEIPNRRHFFENLETQIAMASRHNHQLTMLVLDLDDFKDINDRFGHTIGDTVLRQIAARLKNELRASDAIARLGGEEFGVVLPITSLTESELIAERLKKAVQNPVVTTTKIELRVTTSIGIAKFRDGMTAEDLYREADESMYEAKRLGKNCVFSRNPPNGSSKTSKLGA